MVFSSNLFLLYFFPAVLLIYYAAEARHKNHILLAASVLFYVWGAPRFIAVVLMAILANFYMVQAMDGSKGGARKAWVTVALILNVGVLFYFKYFNFFADNINEILVAAGMSPFRYTHILLPIGISFFTFHEISYVVDVYRRVKPPLERITDYALYILLFPQLIAGPIIRFNEIADQIQDRSSQDTVDFKLTGAFRFVIGLSKKVLIANVLGVEADKIFALHSGDMSTGIAWIGVLAYAFQIYFDFSGYSDMAIGMARMMGFVFPENFNSPYISQSITEFWRRWHMTLSRWMRDYLYIPLGGNRLTTKRMYLNLGLVFVVSGIWHGAAWTFLVWGLFHGGFLILDRLFLLKGLAKIGKFPGMVVTFGITLIGWVLFRSETLPDAGRYICKMFAMDWHHRDVVLDARFWAMMAIATFISFGRTFEIGDRVAKMILANSHSVSRYWVMTTAAAVLFALSIGAVTSSEFNPFIYFRF